MDNFNLPPPIDAPLTTDRATPVVKAVLSAREIDSGTEIVLPFATNDPFLIVARPPNSTVSIAQTKPASLTPILLDLGFLGANRDAMTVFNDTIRGTLHIKYGFGASLTDFSEKVPPQHTWYPLQSWIYYGGVVTGVWDVADGAARVQELT